MLHERFRRNPIMRSILGPPARTVLRRIQRGRTALARQRVKLHYVRWLTSSEGTRPEPYLRSFAPRLSTRLLLWADDLHRGHRPREIGRIYLPSPPIAKVRAVRWHARHYRPKCFVETGTFMGDTTAAVADLFEKCFTIELSDQLHRRAVDRLSKLGNVECLQGDSGRVIADLIQNRLSGPALFWLDAHASGGITTHAGYNPIFAELEAILADRETGHVILIDDARGHQVDRIRQMVSPSRSFTVKNDIIRILPASCPQQP
jgi:hypothetical protein